MEIGEIIWLVSRPLYRPLWAAVIGGVIDCGGTVGSAKGCRVVSSYSIESQIEKNRSSQSYCLNCTRDSMCHQGKYKHRLVHFYSIDNRYRLCKD